MFSAFVYRRQASILSKYTYGSTDSFSYGISSVTGWRRAQEDRFKFVKNLFKDYSYFAVFDGHGGLEVAVYLKRKLHEYIMGFLDNHLDDDIELALKLSFLSCDMSILEPETQEELNAIIAEKTEVSGSEARMRIIKHLTGLWLGQGKDENLGGSEENKELNNSGMGDEGSKSEELGNEYIERVPGQSQDMKVKSHGTGDEGPKSEELGNEYIEGVPGQSQDMKVKSHADEVPNLDEPVSECVEGVAGQSQDVKNKIHDVEKDTVQKKSVDQAEENKKSTADEEGLKLEEPCCEYVEGVPGPSQDVKDKSHDMEAVPSDPPELSSDNMSESADDPSGEEDEDDDSDNKEDAGSKVFQYLKDGALEDSDSDDESYHSEDDETHDTDNEDETAGTGYEATGGNKMLEMEPGVQSGSTATVVFVNRNKLYIANVGDSRCVLSRDGKAVHISVDHLPENEEEKIRILESGATIEDGRINGGLNLSRAFGDFMYKRNRNLDEPHQAVSIVPHVAEIEIDRSMEFIVIASDGIWNSMNSQEVVDFVHLRMKTNDASLDHVCEELFHFILPEKITSDGTGCDNMTCIIIKLNHAPDVENMPKLESNVDYQSMPASLDECQSDAQNVPVRKYGTARKKITRYSNPPPLSHFYAVDLYAPSTSRGTVIQMAKNQAGCSYKKEDEEEDDDDDSDCQIIYERVNPNPLPRVPPKSGQLPENLNMQSFQYSPPSPAEEEDLYCTSPSQIKPGYSISENPVEDAGADSDTMELEEIVYVPDENVTKSPLSPDDNDADNTLLEVEECDDNFKQSDANVACEKELPMKRSKPEDNAKPIGKGSEDLLKNKNDKEPVTSHTGISSENEAADTMDNKPADMMDNKPADMMDNKPVDTMDNKPVDMMDNKPADTMDNKPADMMDNKPADTSGLAKQLKRSSEDETAENLKKTKYM